ncbi:hypothetical protein [Acinetobacter calcoaceticus]
MFKVLQDVQQLMTGVFVEKVIKPLGQKLRHKRKIEARKKQIKEFRASESAITCEFARERIYKKWGWW